MSLSTLWLKGLSSQGKIYLATSSIAIGSGITGTLAVDRTRESIWSGVSYAGSKAGSMLNSLLSIEQSGGGTVGVSNDAEVNEIFKEAWKGLRLVATKGAKWSWSSVTYLGDKATKLKSTYQIVKSYVEIVYEALKEHWQTIWLFLQSSFRDIDLQKLYEWLLKPNTAKTLSQSKGQWQTVMQKFKKLANYSGQIGFNVAKPYQKIFREFMKKPEDLSSWLGTVDRRLSVLDSYLSKKNNSNLQDVNVIIDFFSASEEDIKNIEWSKFKKH
ncbi:hypothetical protein MHLP_03735 [Candidatus Mycoplasma haematolamae str. Purdue]|uniref:Uncharacterized protein n=1 Tax=Mycoplasma haematolamae (strain Purdue) TaxID=1212765 RepID=I7C6Z5_MYCHA|nr:hypothetical protein [Candidatus Mycoplasma haematolamae]AFO52327.1 hypothetical protein MHLP_03735 [Candidatus Mycoplasma haematolamae str. Purdue]